MNNLLFLAKAARYQLMSARGDDNDYRAMLAATRFRAATGRPAFAEAYRMRRLAEWGAGIAGAFDGEDYP